MLSLVYMLACRLLQLVVLLGRSERANELEILVLIQTPIQAPNANAHIERWVGTARRECLDRLLIFNRRQLEHVLRVFVRHYNERRPHRALALRAPDVTAMPSTRGEPRTAARTARRRDLFGGLIHEYEAAPA